MKFAIFLKISILFKFQLFFLFINKILRLNNLEIRTAINAKISVLGICVEVIVDLLVYNLHDCTFKYKDLKFCLQNVILRLVLSAIKCY